MSGRATSHFSSTKTRRAILLSATALASVAATPAAAQFVIDGNRTETIDGAGGGTQTSPWNVGDILVIGDNDSGALRIDNGGAVVSTGAQFLYQGNGNIISNSVEIDNNSTWTINGDLVMNGRRSIIQLFRGSALENANATLGRDAGTEGIVTLGGGSAQTWDNTGTLTIGESGVGRVTLATGFINSVDTILGANAGGRGNVEIGDNSTWTNTNDFTIGAAGSGEVIIDGNNAILEVNRELMIAAGANSSGRVTVRNGGLLEMDANSFFTVGGRGDGSLLIQDGGRVTVNRFTTANVGQGYNGSASVVVDGAGSVLNGTHTAMLIYGTNAAEELRIANGGRVDAQAGGLFVSGDLFDAAIVVDGPGSVLDIDRGLSMTRGSTDLTVSNGGRVILTSGNDPAPINTIGGASGRATLTVDGQGSALEALNTVFVGRNAFSTGSARGVFNIQNGGTATLSDSLIIGSEERTSGDVTVDGPGSSLTAAAISMGVNQNSSGDLNISNGGVVETNSIIVGSSGVAQVFVDGAGSRLQSDNDIMIATSDNTSSPYRNRVFVSNGGTIAVGQGNEIRIAEVVDASGSLTIGGFRSIGAASPGTVDAETIAFGDGGAFVQFVHDAADYTFDADITSDRTANVTGGNHSVVITEGVTRMTGVWDHDGETSIAGGELIANGRIASTSIFTRNDAILSGSGEIAALTLNDDSRLAPGESIGTLTINGALFITDDSTLEIEVNGAGDSDLLDVGGAVRLQDNASLEILPENGTDDGSTYNARTSYTFIQADGGITGSFSSVTEDFAFLDAEVVIENGEARIVLTRATGPGGGNGGGNGGGGNGGEPIRFRDVAVSKNQRGIADAIESLGDGEALYDVVVGLSEEQARSAFDILSGEIHASALAAVMQDSRFAREAVVDRLRSADATAPLSIWGAAYGSWGAWGDSGDNTAAALDRAAAGFLVGADLPLFDSLRLGAVVGVAAGDLEVEARASEADQRAVHLGVYGDWNVFGAATLRAGLSQSWNNLETERDIDIVGFNAFSDRLTAEYNADVFQIFAEAAYGATLGKVNIEPYAGLAYASLSTDDIVETGGAARLDGGGYDMDTTFANLGVRADYAFAFRGADAVIESGLAWRHAFDDTLPRQTFSFAGAGQTFETEGVPLAEDVAVIDVALRLPVTERLGSRLGYNGQFGGGVSDHGVKASISFSF